MRTTIDSLPEELLRDILSYAFYISPTDFCGSRSRWHSLVRKSLWEPRKRRTCHDLLLVCKRWLRVGSPLLFAAVAIRSPAHAAAVAALLRAVPPLGRAVRQLKVFGGYGRDLTAIAQACPNVETLYVYVNVKSNDSIVGIKKALRLLSPTRLWLESRYAYRNKKVEELRMLVDEQIAKWPRLAEVHFNPTYTSLQRQSFASLAHSPSVHEAWLDEDAVRMLLIGDAPDVRAILETASFEKLHCVGRPAEARDDVRRCMDDACFPKAVADKVVFEDYPAGDYDYLPQPQPVLLTPGLLNAPGGNGEDVLGQYFAEEEDPWEEDTEQEPVLSYAAATLLLATLLALPR